MAGSNTFNNRAYCGHQQFQLPFLVSYAINEAEAHDSVLSVILRTIHFSAVCEAIIYIAAR